MKTSRGVALVLVLMITAVLSLLVLQIGLGAKEHVSRASRLLERVEADLRLRSVNATLLYALATNRWDQPLQSASTSPGSDWNFSGRPFAFAGQEVVLQDIAGLVPMPQPGAGTGFLREALEAIGASPSKARDAAERVAATQAAPDLFPLQDLYELELIAGLSRAEIQSLANVVTLYPARYFNPGAAPPGSLASRFSGSVLSGLDEARLRGELDSAAFFRITGSAGDEFIAFYPSPGLKIGTRVSLGAVSAREELSLTVDPYAREPFVIWSRRRSFSGPLN